MAGLSCPTTSVYGSASSSRRLLLSLSRSDISRARVGVHFPVIVAPLRTRRLVVMATSLHQQHLSRSSSPPSPEVLKVWRSVDAVCFDVDSTVCLDEGIDELAAFCGAGEVVAQWTARAMNGSVRFEDALAARLSLFKPSLNQVNGFLEKRPPRISPGIPELMKKLKANKINVYLVSGGFRQMINPVASALGIPPDNIYANQLLFGKSGEFVGFDTEEPTSRSGGKATAVELIKRVHGHKVLAMVGDGATDLEARRPGGADFFICYGGVQLRENVAAKADWLVLSFDDLINHLDR
ncbi:hypothetical protein AMTRI_Chr08g166540 [Amborella trichopoda]|uniref:phosphoserine phosphatase n=1 Tax=Amborella trichopoda TaxID=13333 RepID=W1P5T4_AMBTC|nr:phosphoserine phosphatase, chloroplastic [Amborella trichopoda]ERN05212.1 hypothetical protein AMTR_s00007p00047060 [Amborella trichopoda]|eukprot:XP_006843537.1 phosphoserine phosphatase, chloroplastic [Amborella trichopoda]